MNLKQSIPLVAAIALGLVAAKVAKDMSAKKQTALEPNIKTVQVVVAKGPIAPGTAFGPEQLDVQRIPGDSLPPSAFTTPDSLIGRVTMVPLFDGQPVRGDFLAPKGTPPGLAPLVPQGMRAISVDVNETSSVAGLLTPGCRVDVVSTIGDGSDSGNARTFARTVAQNVPIVAVGQRLSPIKGEGEAKEGPYRTVTMLATPHNAELIELASNTTRIRLVMRGLNDNNKIESEGVTLAELKGRAQNESQPQAVSMLGSTTQPAQAIGYGGPSTRPTDGDDDSRIMHHTVYMIQGGVISSVDCRSVAPDPASMTNVDESPALKN